MIEGVKPEQCRRPEIVADAAHRLLTQPARSCTGRFAIDEEVLREAGIRNFDAYAVKVGTPLLPDLFLN
jgi:citronellol/citronellal dehydrogenase